MQISVKYHFHLYYSRIYPNVVEISLHPNLLYSIMDPMFLIYGKGDKKMKRLIAIVLALIMALSLVAMSLFIFLSPLP